MKLITASIQKKLNKNFAEQNDEDIPLKLFNASGGQTWLITQMEPDGDIMWGLCDLGFGCVEYGTVSLNEMLETKRTMGFRFMLERDLSWKGGKVSDFSGRENLAGC